MAGRNKRKYLSDNDLSELVNRECSDNSESEYSGGSELDFT